MKDKIRNGCLIGMFVGMVCVVAYLLTMVIGGWDVAEKVNILFKAGICIAITSTVSLLGVMLFWITKS